MKIKKYKGYFIVITITSIILLVYLIYYQADMKSLISFNNKRDIDRFVKQLMHENIYEKSFFCVCEYNIQNMFIYSLFLITKNYVYALNIYYILSFFVISVTTFWMLQKFECSVWSSVFGAVLLCFLPYHIERGQGQIVDSTFFMVPLLVGSVYEYLRCEKKRKLISCLLFLLFFHG